MAVDWRFVEGSAVPCDELHGVANESPTAQQVIIGDVWMWCNQ